MGHRQRARRVGRQYTARDHLQRAGRREYGWPYCYGNQITDKTQTHRRILREQSGPAVEMQAHSAPLGLAFYTGDMFPASYKGDLFVAFHGSWNRSVPTGYKVVRVRFANNQPSTTAGDLLVEDFATGWNDNGNVWGRPLTHGRAGWLASPNGRCCQRDLQDLLRRWRLLVIVG